MERMRAKKETKGSWTSLCRLSTKELAKESGTLARVRTRMRRVAREKRERVGRPTRQDTLQLGAGKEEAKTCTPYTKMRVRMPKSQLRMKRSCKDGVYWNMSSCIGGGDQQTKQTKSEESQ